MTYNLFTRFINYAIIFLERRESTFGQIDALRAGIDFLGVISSSQIPEVSKVVLVNQIINLCDQTNNFAQVLGAYPLAGPSNQNQPNNTDTVSELSNVTVRESDEEIVRTLEISLYPPVLPSGRIAISDTTLPILPLIIANDTNRPIQTPTNRHRIRSFSPVQVRRINPNITVENILFPRTELGRPLTRAAG